MQLRIFLQISDSNFEKNECYKNKTKISLPAKYSVSFTDKHAGVIYNILHIKLIIGNDMDKGHYIYYLLDYNTG